VLLVALPRKIKALLMTELSGEKDSAVRAVNLTKRYGPVIAVDRVSLDIKVGEIFGLIGPNGAGKSTLTKMLTTLLPVTSGAAFVGGYDIARQPQAVRAHIGYVPQTLSADGALTGFENMMLSAGLYEIPRRQQAARSTDMLEIMGLSEVAGRLVGHYSGGMIRRLEIGQSLLHRPGVLFMDEPTVGLDPTARKAVWTHLLELRKSLQTTILITTHYVTEVEEYCNRVAVINAGRMAVVGTPQELRTKAGAHATLEDAFAIVVGMESNRDDQTGYDQAGGGRRAIQQHG
jgi:ABC-2 type transport system ATP-binding protein